MLHTYLITIKTVVKNNSKNAGNAVFNFSALKWVNMATPIAIHKVTAAYQPIASLGFFKPQIKPRAATASTTPINRAKRSLMPTSRVPDSPTLLPEILLKPEIKKITARRPEIML